MVVADLEMPAADPSDYVEVVVQGPDGSPVGDLSFQAGVRGSRYSGSSSTRTRKLEDGVWRVHHYAVSANMETDDGTHYLRITSREYGTKEIEYDPDATGRLTVRFDEPATLVVRIAGYVGSGYEGRLHLSVSEDRKNPQHSYFSPYGRSSIDGEGTQTFGPLAPGPKVVRLSIRSSTGNARHLQEAEVVLKPGENRHAIAIPPLYELTVVTDALDPESQISMRPKATEGGVSWSTSAQKATNGRVVFSDLPAGEYTLFAYGKQYGQMDVTVPGPGAVRFVPKEVNAFLVRLKSADGAMASAGLAEGDYVVAVDGEEIKSRKQGYALLSLAREREKTKLTVVRGARSLDLTVAVSDFWGSRDAGGSLEPVTR
jgi:hypothetical protein